MDTPPFLNGTLTDHLARLSQKAGVVATMVLDRSTGSTLRISGQLSMFPVPAANNTSATASTPTASTQTLLPSNGLPSSESSTSSISNLAEADTRESNALATMVWKFVNSTTGLVQGLDGEDELKLLRLRTKKYELVIVPDTKFLLVVVHETPTA